MQLVVRNARTRKSREPLDIGIDFGKFTTFERHLTASGDNEIDAGGRLVLPPFTNIHMHIDKCLTGQWRNAWSDAGSSELIPNASKLKARIKESEIERNATRVIQDSVAFGVLHLRAFCDVDSINRLKSIRIVLKLKEHFKRSIKIQVVAFPQEGIIRDPETGELLRQALDLGADVVGGIPWLEKTKEAKEKHIDIVFQLAKEYDRDIHTLIDDNEDPNSTCIEYLARKTIKEGFPGRVSASHCRGRLSLAYDVYARKIFRLLREAEVTVVENPHISLLIYGRTAGYPKSRGLTRVKELVEAGVNVAIGQDDIDDPYYPFGRGDMLELGLFMAHAAHMSSVSEVEEVIDMITSNGAKAMRERRYGLDVGKDASMVVLNAETTHEALRRQSERSHVIKDGRIVSETTAITRQYLS